MDGKLVRLRGYEKSDLDAVMRWINDEEVTELLGGEMVSAPVSSAAEERFIEGAAEPSPTRKIFVIESLAGSKYLGSIDLRAINWHSRNAGVGIVIGEKALWGKGYGSDAMRVPMRLAFDKMNLHRLWLHVFDFNPRAIASYEKCGFKREAVMREDRFHRGRYHDTIVMGILAEEYRALIRRD